MSETIEHIDGVTRTCDGCGRVEDAGAYPDQDDRGRSECCWDDEDDDEENE
jgi:hypothetical protein